ncbi:MAG: VOC family protein [Pseudomonadota bacterium]
MNASLEHINITVANAETTAAWLDRVFGWKIRWRGSSIHGGRSIHVGDSDRYLAIYTPPFQTKPGESSYGLAGGLNHVGVLVDDLDAVEERVKAEGFSPHSHADYEPGRRFYFDDPDGIEFEVVSYA